MFTNFADLIYKSSREVGCAVKWPLNPRDAPLPENKGKSVAKNNLNILMRNEAPQPFKIS